MAEKKTTKREFYGMVEEVVNASDVENKQEILDFIAREVEILDAKAAKAAERAAAKKVEGDELRAAVEAVLTDELQTADGITEKLGNPEVTKQMVVSRLTQLVKTGVAMKDSIRVDKRTLVAYKLA